MKDDKILKMAEAIKEHRDLKLFEPTASKLMVLSHPGRMTHIETLLSESTKQLPVIQGILDRHDIDSRVLNNRTYEKVLKVVREMADGDL